MSCGAFGPKDPKESFFFLWNHPKKEKGKKRMSKEKHVFLTTVGVGKGGLQNGESGWLVGEKVFSGQLVVLTFN